VVWTGSKIQILNFKPQGRGYRDPAVSRGTLCGACFTAMKMRLLHAARSSMKAAITKSHGRMVFAFMVVVDLLNR
jgi:hypothetical protein